MINMNEGNSELLDYLVCNDCHDDSVLHCHECFNVEKYDEHREEGT